MWMLGTEQHVLCLMELSLHPLVYAAFIFRFFLSILSATSYFRGETISESGSNTHRCLHTSIVNNLLNIIEYYLIFSMNVESCIIPPFF